MREEGGVEGGREVRGGGERVREKESGRERGREEGYLTQTHHRHITSHIVQIIMPLHVYKTDENYISAYIDTCLQLCHIFLLCACYLCYNVPADTKNILHCIYIHVHL